MPIEVSHAAKTLFSVQFGACVVVHRWNTGGREVFGGGDPAKRKSMLDVLLGSRIFVIVSSLDGENATPEDSTSTLNRRRSGIRVARNAGSSTATAANTSRKNLDESSTGNGPGQGSTKKSGVTDQSRSDAPKASPNKRRCTYKREETRKGALRSPKGCVENERVRQNPTYEARSESPRNRDRAGHERTRHESCS